MVEGGESEPGISPPPPKKKNHKRVSEPEGSTCGWAASVRVSPGGIQRAALVPGFQGHFNPVCWLLEQSHGRGCWGGNGRSRAALSGERQEVKGDKGETGSCLSSPIAPPRAASFGVPRGPRPPSGNRLSRGPNTRRHPGHWFWLGAASRAPRHGESPALLPSRLRAPRGNEGPGELGRRPAPSHTGGRGE